MRSTVFASIVVISSQKLPNPLADHQLKKAEKSNQLNKPNLLCFTSCNMRMILHLHHIGSSNFQQMLSIDPQMLGPFVVKTQLFMYGRIFADYLQIRMHAWRRRMFDMILLEMRLNACKCEFW